MNGIYSSPQISKLISKASFVFDQQGLSLDQAPPISVIFGLFVLGGIFGVVSGGAVLYYGNTIFDPSSTGAVVIAHLLSLGVMMSFMLGALFQMLPVIAGVVLRSPIPKSNLVKVLLILGLISLIAGFMTHAGFLFIFSSIFLGGSLLYLSVTMSARLFVLSNHSASSRGMLFALIGMGVFVLMALYMTTAYGQMHDGSLFMEIKRIHYSYALFGWIALLISSISFQTVEMFYVTPPYPKWFSKYLPPAIFVLLAAYSVTVLVDNDLSTVVNLHIYVLFGIYGVLTLIRLSQRKRPLSDATVWFWRTGMVSLVGSMVLLTMSAFIDQKIVLEIALVLFIFFVFSVLFAMFYKIVPFLTWFHLNAEGYLTAPMMHEVIHPKTAKKHLWIHWAGLVVFLMTTLLPTMIYVGGFLMILSFGWATYQIITADKIYKNTQQTGERFSFHA